MKKDGEDTARAEPRERSAYHCFTRVPTRWIDNDLYGHVNNAVYYQYFDTVANAYLIDEGGLDIRADTVAFIVASSCQYHSPITHPANIDAGFRVNHLGSRSVEYGIGLFLDDVVPAVAHGTFTHVFVSRSSARSVQIPERIRDALARAVR